LALSYLSGSHRFVLSSLLCFQQRDEFESFLQDRVHTIRVWRSLGGGGGDNIGGSSNISSSSDDIMTHLHELGEHYCLRGLEPYRSAAHNAEMHSLRYLYTTSILNEQDRLHALCGGKHDPFSVSGQVAHLSHRAMQQARLLAIQDEKDAKEDEASSSSNQHQRKKRNSNGAPINAHRRKSSMSRRHTMNHTSNSSNTTSGLKLAAPPLSLSPPTTTRNKVDVTLLKEMNAQFLQTLMASRQASAMPLSSSGSSDTTKLGESVSGKDMGPLGGSSTMALSSLMWNSGHPAARHLQMTHPCGPHRSFLATAPSSAMSNNPTTMSMRRHSLDLNHNVERNEAIMSQPFLAIRRDSLHCLLSSSSAHSAQTQPS
jgi:hypothetical protein